MNELRIAMLGMVEGNGHPYSWSAIVNGYDPLHAADCPYPGILDYLRPQPPDTFGIEGAKVTHVWTDRPEDADRVARFARIPHVVASPLDAIGGIDAAIIATDDGDRHLERCRPFVEAGIPVFIDKPLTLHKQHLERFVRWEREGRLILSSSCMRYGKEFAPYRLSTANLGEIRLATVTTHRSWERYGIHALEAVYSIIGPGFESIRFVGRQEDADRSHMLLRHRTGTEILIFAIEDMLGSFGCLNLYGTRSHAQAQFSDTFYAFKSQLSDFVRYVRTGESPIPFAETAELMSILIGGVQSREAGGTTVHLTGHDDG